LLISATSLAGRCAALETKVWTRPYAALTKCGLHKDLNLAAAVQVLTQIVGGHFTYLDVNTVMARCLFRRWVGAVPRVQAFAYSNTLAILVLEFDDAGNVTSASGETILRKCQCGADPALPRGWLNLRGPIEEVKGSSVQQA